MKMIVPMEVIERKIYMIRGHKVMLDSDLAELYGVPIKALNQAVKRNISRFPEDFMFQPTKREKAEVVANCDHLKRTKTQTYRISERKGKRIKKVYFGNYGKCP